MRRIPTTFVPILVVAVSLISGCASQERSAQEQPNIVFILTDDMRTDDLEHMPKTQEILVKEGTHLQ